MMQLTTPDLFHGNKLCYFFWLTSSGMSSHSVRIVLASAFQREKLVHRTLSLQLICGCDAQQNSCVLAHQFFSGVCWVGKLCSHLEVCKVQCAYSEGSKHCVSNRGHLTLHSKLGFNQSPPGEVLPRVQKNIIVAAEWCFKGSFSPHTGPHFLSFQGSQSSL